MTQIIVPTDTPGFNIVRRIPVWGHESNHCEIEYKNVRVPSPTSSAAPAPATRPPRTASAPAASSTA
jgi:acyl-CoA dehydrogenase